MADIRWTDDQLDAITCTGSNILVSAAAGSGKTAVLVERVMRRILGGEDIGSFLIMTFTRAAASQMKEKIYKGIRNAIKADPSNEHLKKQLHEVSSARIYTIDALSMEIVRNHFHSVDIDPGFRVADESESAILKSEVLSEMIESHYADPSPEFLQFVSFYIDKSDARIEDIILRLYAFSQSHPEPERWIRRSVSAYTGADLLAAGKEDEDPDSMEGALLWMEALKDAVGREISSVKSQAEMGLRICNMNYGPYKYEELFSEIIEFADSVSGDDATFDYRAERIREFLEEWKRSPAIGKNDEVDPALKDAASEIRKKIRSDLQNLYKRFFEQELEQAYADMSACASVAGVIADLALEFDKRYAAAKKERNIAEFNDIAHLALKVLLKYDGRDCIIRGADGAPVYTEAADSMALEISEIIVDEYQDTNLIQEYMIGALSRERFGQPNVFMVGDVKQSIYGFRMACPELFNEKYGRFASREDAGRRILLNANFRSRHEVLDLTNAVFEQAMIPDVGGIDYTDGHGLVCGASYPGCEDKDMFSPEFICVNGSGEDARNSEAYLIAERIQELIRSGVVSDTENGGFRPVGYGDIAILTRGTDNPEIERTLEDMKIPFIRSSNKGFFDSFEIRLVMDFLKITDNPYQDIPFTAVLTSPAFDISSEELAIIKTRTDSASMYEACMQLTASESLPQGGSIEASVDYGDGNAILEALQIKIRNFLHMLDSFRQRSGYMGICDLIEYILEKSGLDNIIAAMPQGEGRRANIEFLKSKAASGSKGSYPGLFNFLRVVEQMRSSEIDFGQSQVFEVGIDAVTIMTIHKSKGLEFPVVFVSRTGKDYNRSDQRDNIIMDRTLGVGLELRDVVERTVRPTLLMETIRSKTKTEQYAEEMRLLYVAMTRAKEKLIITGSYKGLEGAAAVWARRIYGGRMGRLEYGEVMSCGNFMKLLGMTLSPLPSGAPFRELAGCDISIPSDSHQAAVGSYRTEFKAIVSDILDVETERAEEIFDRSMFLREAESFIQDARPQKDTGAQLNWIYPYMEASEKVIKITASQLEDHSRDAADRGAQAKPKPFAVQDEDMILKGAERGNAYHRLFELIDYGAEPADEKMIGNMISGYVEKGLMSDEYARAIDPIKISAFLTSDIGRRMKAAALSGKLRREQQFVMGFDDGGEQRLVQGIIDAFFEEDGELVLVDYKTDRKKSDEDFIFTYRGQLDVYRRALEAACGLKVKEQVIYSVELGREIYLPT